MKQRGRKRGQSQRGMALITVLWMLVMLSAVVIGLGVSARTETRLARNHLDAARARHLAEAGMQRAILALLDAREAPLLRPDGSRGIELRLAGGVVLATVQDECGKIDLNTGWGELIRGAVQVAGMGGRDADAVTDAILDWRDPDDQRRPRGAERREYERAGKVGPRNGPFATVEELREVMGVTPELYRRMEPMVTVHCLQAGLDPRVAPLPALRAIPGIRDREVEEVGAQRRRSLDRGDPLPNPALSGIGRYSAQSPGFAYTIQAAARLENGAESRIEAQVWLQPDGERPYALLGLRETLGASGP
ncbi:MAG: general secretion pathway protein GspK [Alphaproteobacteria bacterium]|nr:general secretion pathway protein GspK [Alphaproteobacteria bacterium]